MCGGVAIMIQLVTSTGHSESPWFILLWLAICNVMGTSNLLSLRILILMDEIKCVHPVCVITALCQSGKLVDSCSDPAVLHHSVWMSQEFSAGHPLTQLFVPDQSCIESTVDCRLVDNVVGMSDAFRLVSQCQSHRRP